MRLNERATLDQDLGDSIDWSPSASLNHKWAPEILSHLFHLDGYKNLSPQIRLRYNQFFSMLVIEQIASFERDVLAKVDTQVFKRLKERNSVEQHLKIALEHFVREEKNHVDFFEKLVAKSKTALGLESGFRSFQVSGLQGRFVSFLFSSPRFFIFWIWVVLFVEERTLLIARLMRKDSDSYDPLHFQVQQAHLRDETRHVQLDEHLLEVCWDQAPALLKKLNVFLLKVFFEMTFVRSMSAVRLWKLFSRHVPEAATHTNEVVNELRTLSKNTTYLLQFFSQDSAPRFWKMLNSRAEMAPLSRYLRGKIESLPYP